MQEASSGPSPLHDSSNSVVSKVYAPPSNAAQCVAALIPHNVLHSAMKPDDYGAGVFTLIRCGRRGWVYTTTGRHD